MKVSYLYIQRRLKILSMVRGKQYTLENSINAYHLLCDGKFLVADESLAVLNVVIGALMRDGASSKELQNVCTV